MLPVLVAAAAFTTTVAVVAVVGYAMYRCTSRQPVTAKDGVPLHRGWERQPASTTVRVLEAAGPHRATLIWLHGLGDSGDGWKETLAGLGLRNTRVLLPQAPIQPVTVNGGMHMPAWYDVLGLSVSAPQDLSGIAKACKDLASLVRKEIATGVDPKQIILGGFSQGGSVALHTAFVEGYLDDPVGACIALSSWMPRGPELQSAECEFRLAPASLKTPVMMAHGTLDPLVRVQYGELSSKILRQHGAEVQFRTYEQLGHSTCASELSDVQKFLMKIMAGPAS